MAVLARTNAPADEATNGAVSGATEPVELSGREGVTVVRTAGGRYYHDPACPVVRNRAPATHALSAREVGGLAPCRICRPPDPGDLVL